MARYFLDSSALVKRYHREVGTPVVEGVFNEPAPTQLLISRLALVEVHSSLARLVRERVLSREDFGKLIGRLEADVAAGLLIVAAVSTHRLAATSELLGTLGFRHPIRTLDAIHLTTAQALNRRTRITKFIGADKQLLAIAAACGFDVLDVG